MGWLSHALGIVGDKRNLTGSRDLGQRRRELTLLGAQRVGLLLITHQQALSALQIAATSERAAPMIALNSRSEYPGTVGSSPAERRRCSRTSTSSAIMPGGISAKTRPTERISPSSPPLSDLRAALSPVALQVVDRQLRGPGRRIGHRFQLHNDAPTAPEHCRCALGCPQRFARSGAAGERVGQRLVPARYRAGFECERASSPVLSDRGDLQSGRGLLHQISGFVDAGQTFSGAVTPCPRLPRQRGWISLSSGHAESAAMSVGCSSATSRPIRLPRARTRPIRRGPALAGLPSRAR
jgi:hypothetical protein